MKIKTTFEYLVGIIVGIWCLFNVYDGWSVTNWYELLISYMIIIFPFALGLLFISRHASKKRIGWQKKIAIAGVFTSIISLIFPLLQIVYVILAYY